MVKTKANRRKKKHGGKKQKKLEKHRRRIKAQQHARPRKKGKK